MKFENPEPVERDLAERLLTEGTQEEVAETLVGLALGGAELGWVQAHCFRLLGDARWSVRAIAATCLGHLARIHRQLDLNTAIPMLEVLLKDEQVAGYADEALDDIRRYVPS